MYAQRKNQHLLWRAGFGPAADQFEMIRTQPPERIFGLMLEAAQKKPVLFDVADPTLKAMVMGNDADPLSMRRN